MAVSEEFCEDFVDISYENASCRILEALLWLQLIYFLITAAFWIMNYFFWSMGRHSNLITSECGN